MSSILLSGCQGKKGSAGPSGPQGPAAPVPAVMPGPSEVEKLVDLENDYRFSVGQTLLTKGLVCTLYTVPSGSSGITGTTLTSVTSFTYVGAFNQDDVSASIGISVLPVSIRALYTSWYVVRCTGKIVVEMNGFYEFDLKSDDGSMLYIDGSLLVNNDGNHGTTLKSGMKNLRLGVHDFRLDYMQGPAGNESLMLSSGPSLIPAANFYH